jgi:hypothetical protein
MTSGPSLTARSRFFRRKASEIGQLLADEQDQESCLKLVHQALSWIQLAENEETLYADAQSGSVTATAIPDTIAH